MYCDFFISRFTMFSDALYEYSIYCQHQTRVWLKGRILFSLSLGFTLLLPASSPLRFSLHLRPSLLQFPARANEGAVSALLLSLVDSWQGGRRAQIRSYVNKNFRVRKPLPLAVTNTNKSQSLTLDAMYNCRCQIL